MALALLGAAVSVALSLLDAAGAGLLVLGSWALLAKRLSLGGDASPRPSESDGGCFSWNPEKSSLMR